MEPMNQQEMEQFSPEMLLKQQKKQIRKDFSRIGWGFGVMLAASQLAAIPLALLGNKFPAFGESPLFSWALMILPIYLVGLPLMLLITRKMPAQKAEHHQSLDFPGFLQVALVSLGATYFFNIISGIINSIIALLKGDVVTNPLSTLENMSPWLTILFAGCLVPALEEMVFRGVLISKVRKYGEGVAVLLSGFVFGLFHGNLSQMLYACALGMIFAYVTLKTGTIRYAVFLHMIVNTIGTVLIPMLAMQGNWGAIAAVIIMAVFICAGFFFFTDHRRNLHFGPGQTEVPQKRAAVIFFNPGMIFYMAICAVMVVIMAML